MYSINFAIFIQEALEIFFLERIYDLRDGATIFGQNDLGKCFCKFQKIMPVDPKKK